MNANEVAAERREEIEQRLDIAKLCASLPGTSITDFYARDVEILLAALDTATAAERERIAREIEQRADALAQVDGKPYSWAADVKAHRCIADMIRRNDFYRASQLVRDGGG